MMSLLLRDSTNFVREIQRGFEVGKLELFLDVVIVDDVPVFDLSG